MVDWLLIDEGAKHHYKIQEKGFKTIKQETSLFHNNKKNIYSLKKHKAWFIYTYINQAL